MLSAYGSVTLRANRLMLAEGVRSGIRWCATGRETRPKSPLHLNRHVRKSDLKDAKSESSDIKCALHRHTETADAASLFEMQSFWRSSFGTDNFVTLNPDALIQHERG